MSKVSVSIIMGSRSDWPTMQEATKPLEELGVEFETKVVSAHRTPERLFKFASEAHTRGIEVIIAGAGGAAHDTVVDGGHVADTSQSNSTPWALARSYRALSKAPLSR